MKTSHSTDRVKTLCVGIALVVAFSAAPAIGATKPKGNALDNQMAKFEMKPGLNPLWRLCPQVDIPCGVEVSFGDLPEEKGKAITLADTSPRKVLDEIVRRHPGYQWVNRDGVINLEPVKRAAEDYLSRKIAALSFRGDSSLKAVLDVLETAQIPFGYQTAGRQGRYARITTEFKDISVRDALNTIARMDGQMMWIISVSADGNWTTLQVHSWHKTGVQFSEQERQKVREQMKRRKAK